LDLELFEHSRDLRPAAVYNDWIHTRQLEVDDVLGERLSEGGVPHGMAAEFDDNRLVVIALQIRQRLGENLRLRMRRDGAFCTRALRIVGSAGHIASFLA